MTFLSCIFAPVPSPAGRVFRTIILSLAMHLAQAFLFHSDRLLGILVCQLKKRAQPCLFAFVVHLHIRHCCHHGRFLFWILDFIWFAEHRSSDEYVLSPTGACACSIEPWQHTSAKAACLLAGSGDSPGRGVRRASGAVATSWASAAGPAAGVPSADVSTDAPTT